MLFYTKQLTLKLFLLQANHFYIMINSQSGETKVHFSMYVQQCSRLTTHCYKIGQYSFLAEWQTLFQLTK